VTTIRVAVRAPGGSPTRSSNAIHARTRMAMAIMTPQTMSKRFMELDAAKETKRENS
jgi:hypothetical protein